MSVSKKWRNIAAGLFLSVATVGAVSTVAATPSQAADVGFGIVVRDHDRYHNDRFTPRRYYEAGRYHQADWRRAEYQRAREREHAREAWRDHQRWDHRYDDHHRW